MSESRVAESGKEKQKTIQILIGIGSLLLLPVVGPFLVKENRYRMAQRFSYLPGIDSSGGWSSALAAVVYILGIYSLFVGGGAATVDQIMMDSDTNETPAINNSTESTPTPLTTVTPTSQPATESPTSTSTETEKLGVFEKREIEEFGRDVADQIEAGGLQDANSVRRNDSIYINYTYPEDGDRTENQLWVAGAYTTVLSSWGQYSATAKPDRIHFTAYEPDGSWAHEGYIESEWAEAEVENRTTWGAYAYSFLSTTSGGPTVGIADNESVESREERLQVTEDRMRHRIQENMSVHKLRSVSHNDSYLKVSYTVASKGRSAGVVSSNFSIQYAVHSGLYGPDYLPSEGVEVTTFTPDGERYTRYYVYNNKSIGHYSGYISGSQYFLDVQGTVSFYQEPR